jgi:hypothetical protein
VFIDAPHPFQRHAYRVVYGLLIVALSGFCLIHFQCWLASYLEWPWSPDHDVFATLARSWDAGVLPYRDLYANNPPPTIYLYWMLGKMFGWGHTMPFFAFDATLVVGLAVIMLLWSGRVFATVLPGLLGCFLFLRYYLPLDYAMSGERDWHASLLAAVAIMVIQAWSGRRARIASALALAMAAAIRPQAALFLPAVALALAMEPHRKAASWRIVARNELEFAFAFAGFFALVFVPLLCAGILDDFCRSFRRAAYGGIRNPLTAAILCERVSGLLAQTHVSVPIALTLVLAFYGQRRSRHLACVWLAAAIASVIYKPISPRQHDYLDLPRFLVLSATTAAVVGLILRARMISSWPKLGIGLLLVALCVQVPPSPHEVRWSYATWQELRQGEPLISYSTGYSGPYSQYEYHEVLDYIKKLSPELCVANALAYPLAITGPTGRLSAFPAESLAWLRNVRRDDEDAFARELERTPNSVVVWCPSEFDTELSDFSRLEETIHRLYEPEKQFYVIELWRRKAPTP